MTEKISPSLWSDAVKFLYYNHSPALNKGSLLIFKDSTGHVHDDTPHQIKNHCVQQDPDIMKVIAAILFPVQVRYEVKYEGVFFGGWW